MGPVGVAKWDVELRLGICSGRYRYKQRVDAGFGSKYGRLTCDDSIWVSLG